MKSRQRYTIMTLKDIKDKEKTLKAAREKAITATVYMIVTRGHALF